uniref:Groucho/TLE N-terminal Q-rich domain-containing protein n=1 Tax=Xiphophorus couchianus TaxID=32473 RepID=A0A3B5LVU9_9TELE
MQRKKKSCHSGRVQKSIFEIVKRLSAICAQIIPFLSQEHQQQVVQAVERAKQVTMAELNAIIGVTRDELYSGLLALTGALGVSAHLASKDERNHLDPEHLRGKNLWILCRARQTVNFND